MLKLSQLRLESEIEGDYTDALLPTTGWTVDTQQKHKILLGFINLKRFQYLFLKSDYMCILIYARVAQIKKVIVLMAYFVFSDH